MPQRKKKNAPKPPPTKTKTVALARLEPLSISQTIEKVLIQGDLAPLTVEERVDYYKKVSKSLGLNPLTQPFSYILFREADNSPAKLSLYANKSCAEQLRKMHGVSVVKSDRIIENDCAIYEVTVSDRTGRTDSAAGIVPLSKYKDGKRIDFSGREWANAVMKAHTKAKRRATLSICGLAFLDESELDTMQVLGGVTPDGRIYRYPQLEDAQPANGLDESAPHGHEPGSRKAQTAEETLRRVEEADREALEERKAIQAEPIEKAAPAKRQPAPPIPEEKVQDIWPKSSGGSRGSTPEVQESGSEGAGPAEPLLYVGVIEQANPQSGKSPRLDVLLKVDKVKHWLSAWDTAHFPYLSAGKGAPAEIYIVKRAKGDKTYSNIVGLKLCAGKHFDVDGKTPVIQNSQREAGGKTLF